jgi:hypothetical protein
MKYAFTILVMALLLTGCGHMIGDDARGVTGGSDCGDYDYAHLYGNWQQNLTNGDVNTVIFSTDGTVKVNFQAGNSATGTFYISGDRLDINVPGWKSGSETITLDGNTMTLTKDAVTTILHKII